MTVCIKTILLLLYYSAVAVCTPPDDDNKGEGQNGKRGDEGGGGKDRSRKQRDRRQANQEDSQEQDESRLQKNLAAGGGQKDAKDGQAGARGAIGLQQPPQEGKNALQKYQGPQGMAPKLQVIQSGLVSKQFQQRLKRAKQRKQRERKATTKNQTKMRKTKKQQPSRKEIEQMARILRIQALASLQIQKMIDAKWQLPPIWVNHPPSQSEMKMILESRGFIDQLGRKIMGLLLRFYSLSVQRQLDKIRLPKLEKQALKLQAQIAQMIRSGNTVGQDYLMLKQQQVKHKIRTLEKKMSRYYSASSQIELLQSQLENLGLQQFIPSIVRHALQSPILQKQQKQYKILTKTQSKDGQKTPITSQTSPQLNKKQSDHASTSDESSQARLFGQGVQNVEDSASTRSKQSGRTGSSRRSSQSGSSGSYSSLLRRFQALAGKRGGRLGRWWTNKPRKTGRQKYSTIGGRPLSVQRAIGERLAGSSQLSQSTTSSSQLQEPCKTSDNVKKGGKKPKKSKKQRQKQQLLKEFQIFEQKLLAKYKQEEQKQAESRRAREAVSKLAAEAASALAAQELAVAEAAQKASDQEAEQQLLQRRLTFSRDVLQYGIEIAQPTGKDENTPSQQADIFDFGSQDWSTFFKKYQVKVNHSLQSQGQEGNHKDQEDKSSNSGTQEETSVGANSKKGAQVQRFQQKQPQKDDSNPKNDKQRYLSTKKGLVLIEVPRNKYPTLFQEKYEQDMYVFDDQFLFQQPPHSPRNSRDSLTRSQSLPNLILSARNQHGGNIRQSRSYQDVHHSRQSLSHMQGHHRSQQSIHSDSSSHSRGRNLRSRSPQPKPPSKGSR